MILIALLTLGAGVLFLRFLFFSKWNDMTPERGDRADCVYCHGSGTYRYESGKDGPCPVHGRHNTNRRLVD